MSTLGIQQDLLVADAVQKLRRKRLGCQHIGIFLETIFKIAEQAAKLENGADTPLLNSEI